MFKLSFKSLGSILFYKPQVIMVSYTLKEFHSLENIFFCIILSSWQSCVLGGGRDIIITHVVTLHMLRKTQAGLKNHLRPHNRWLSWSPFWNLKSIQVCSPLYVEREYFQWQTLTVKSLRVVALFSKERKEPCVAL